MMWFALGLIVGYYGHRLLLNLGGKAVYSESDMLHACEAAQAEGWQEGYMRGLHD